MKKFLVVLMALLFATGAFAQDAKKSAEFKYSVFAQAEGVTEKNYKVDLDPASTVAPVTVEKQYSDIRVRPKFTFGTDDVKVVTFLEIDQYFGADSAKDAGYADLGVDNKVVEVKNIYIEAKPMTALTLKGGAMAYKYPMVADDDFAMWSAAYDFGMGSVTFAYAKTWESGVAEKTTNDAGVKTETKDDSQVYIIDATVKAGAINVRPALFISQSEENSKGVYKKSVGYVPAINVNADMGAFAIDATAAYATGKDKVSDEKYTGYALDVYPTFKLAENMKLGVFFTYMTGDKDSSTDKNESYSNAVGAFDSEADGMGRLYILDDANSLNTGMEQAWDITPAGYMSYGVTFNASMDKLAVTALIGSSSLAQSESKKGLGYEFDLNVSYGIATGTTLWVEGGYLMAGDVFTKDIMPEENINPMYAAFGLTTSL